MVMNATDPGEIRVAILEDGELSEIFIERKSHNQMTGNIYKGRVVNIEPSLQAAFIDLGTERNGFLHVSDVLPPDGGYGDILRGTPKKASAPSAPAAPAEKPAEPQASREPQAAAPASQGQAQAHADGDGVQTSSDQDEGEGEGDGRGRRRRRRRGGRGRRGGRRARVPNGAAPMVASASGDPSATVSSDALAATPSPPTLAVSEPDTAPARVADTGEWRGDTESALPEPSAMAPVPQAEAPPAMAEGDEPLVPADLPTPPPTGDAPVDAEAPDALAEVASGDDEPVDDGDGRAVDFDADQDAASEMAETVIEDDDDEDADEAHDVEVAAEAPDVGEAPAAEHLEADVDEAPVEGAEIDEDFDEVGEEPDAESVVEDAEVAEETSVRDDKDGDVNGEDGDEEANAYEDDGSEEGDDTDEDGDGEEGDGEEGGGDERRGRRRQGRSFRGRTSGRRGAPRRDKDRETKRYNIQDLLKKGQEILVQVAKEGLGQKGPALTTYLSIPGRYVVVMPAISRLGVSKRIENEEQRRTLKQHLQQVNPPEGMGVIVRTAGQASGVEDLKRDVAYLTHRWDNIKKKTQAARAPQLLYEEGDVITRVFRDIMTDDVTEIYVDDEVVLDRAKAFMKEMSPGSEDKIQLYHSKTPIFHKFNVEPQIQRLYNRMVPLKSGGSIVIEQTEALVAIDVNTGRFREKRTQDETILAINLEAAREVARQLRLRDIGGLVMIDLIDMENLDHRRKVERELKAHLARDRARINVMSISNLGIVEMTRQRVRHSLRKQFFEKCPHCAGVGQVKSPETMGLELMRELHHVMGGGKMESLRVALNPCVAFGILNRFRKELVKAESTYGTNIEVIGDETVPPSQWRVYTARPDGNWVLRKASEVDEYVRNN